jgi:hypothetical protein
MPLSVSSSPWMSTLPSLPLLNKRSSTPSSTHLIYRRLPIQSFLWLHMEI